MRLELFHQMWFIAWILLTLAPIGTGIASHHQDIQEVEIREKRDVDGADLVVDTSYDMKTNKEITGFTEEEKRNMLHMHNAYRSLVRPYAADMIELTWDDDIAAFAQEWANKCTATHQSNRDLSPWVNMGENLYWWYSGSYNEATSTKWWWDEVEFYNLRSKECEAGKVCGHYVTLTWAKTERIGCGVNRCARLADLPDYGRGAYYFVCNYSGRFLSDTKPYKATDLPCSSCHRTNFPKCRYNLCVTQEMIDKDIGYNGSTSITGLERLYTRTYPKTVTTPSNQNPKVVTTTTTTTPTTPTTKTTKLTTATTTPPETTTKTEETTEKTKPETTEKTKPETTEKTKPETTEGPISPEDNSTRSGPSDGSKIGASLNAQVINSFSFPLIMVALFSSFVIVSVI